MKRVQVLVALIIGFSVVFIVQNELNKNWINSASSNDSPPVNSPANPQTNLPGNPPSNLPKNPPNKLPTTLTNPSNLVPEATPIKDNANRPKNVATPSDHSANDPIVEDDTSDYPNEPKDNEPGESEPTEHVHKEHHHHVHEHQDDKSASANFNNQNVNYILLVSYFRSGSGFVGDLLQQPNATFYTFEPLKFFAFNHKVDSDREEEALRILQNIFQCSLYEEEEYSDSICSKEPIHAHSSIYRNHFLWKSCQSNDSICCDTNYIDGVCSQTKIRIIKETRISLESVEKLLQRLPKSINMEVVVLLRDPRGIYNSRKNFKWCKKTSCIDYEQLCEDLTSDLKVYPRLVETYGNKVKMLRFEDIALDPFTKSEALYKSLGLPYTSDIIEFIDTHTNENISDISSPFSFIRNPREIIRRWVKQLNETIVDSIQNSCEFVFQQLGYKPIVLSEVTEISDDLSEIYENTYSLPNHL